MDYSMPSSPSPGYSHISTSSESCSLTEDTVSTGIDEEEFLASQVQTHEDNDAAIAAELNKLSMAEREDILYDLHGVSDNIDETEELLSNSLAEMERLLDSGESPSLFSSSSTIRKSAGYELAESRDPSYVKDRNFRLMFLRGEDFQARPAALKMQAFMDQKLELFGEDRLCRTITLDDLDEDDVACLRNGHMQWLRSRDRAGRAVIVVQANFITYTVYENELRQMFYLYMSALEEEETQKKGIVFIAVGLPKQDPRIAWRVTQLIGNLPYRIRGWHVINPVLGPLFGWLSAILEKRARMRIRTHSGSYAEVMYSLMTFGILTSDFPCEGDDWAIQRVAHHAWIEGRKRIENTRALAQTMKKDGSTVTTAASPRQNNIDKMQGATMEAISPEQLLLPSNKDVLFGRGRPYQEHAGNLRLSSIIESLKPRYEELKRTEKTLLAGDVVKKMKGQGTRFLRQIDGYWKEVDDSVAREKVSQGFRSLRSGKTDLGMRKSKAKQNDDRKMDGSESSTGKRVRNA